MALDVKTLVITRSQSSSLAAKTSMDCQTNLEDYGLYGWPCDTTLTNVNVNKSLYCFSRGLSNLAIAINSSLALNKPISVKAPVASPPIKVVSNSRTFATTEPPIVVTTFLAISIPSAVSPAAAGTTPVPAAKRTYIVF